MPGLFKMLSRRDSLLGHQARVRQAPPLHMRVDMSSYAGTCVVRPSEKAL